MKLNALITIVCNILIVMFFINSPVVDAQSSLNGTKQESVKIFEITEGDLNNGVLIKEEFFDKNGNLIKSVEYKYDYETKQVYKEITDTYEYDENNNEIMYVSDQGGWEMTSATTYNDKGQIIKQVSTKSGDTDMIVHYSYDEDGRVAEEKIYWGPDFAYSYVFEYKLDSKGRVLEKKAIIPYNNFIAESEDIYLYEFDENDNLTAEKQLNSDGSCCYEQKLYSYNADGKLLERQETDGAFTYFYEYAYDDKGNKISEAESSQYGDMDLEAESIRYFSYNESGDLILEIIKDENNEFKTGYRHEISYNE